MWAAGAGTPGSPLRRPQSQSQSQTDARAPAEEEEAAPSGLAAVAAAHAGTEAMTTTGGLNLLAPEAEGPALGVVSEDLNLGALV